MQAMMLIDDIPSIKVTVKHNNRAKSSQRRESEYPYIYWQQLNHRDQYNFFAEREIEPAEITAASISPLSSLSPRINLAANSSGFRARVLRPSNIIAPVIFLVHITRGTGLRIPDGFTDR